MLAIAARSDNWAGLAARRARRSGRLRSANVIANDRGALADADRAAENQSKRTRDRLAR